jgi:hypothetical protein
MGLKSLYENKQFSPPQGETHFGFTLLTIDKNVHSAGGLKTGQNWSAVEYKAISG